MDQIKQMFLIWEKDRKEKSREQLFSQIWEVYHPKLQVYVSHFYIESVENTDLASDILLHIFETIDRYNSTYSFSTWLYTVARNYSVDRIRKKQIIHEDLDACNRGDENTPESIFTRNTEQELIKEALSCLNPTDKELIFLHFYEGLKYREISGITGIPEGTVKYRMSETRKVLKKKLERSFAL